ncbi:MAG: hypothetical protein WCE62_10205 [Polyangiales bacterium]
MTAIKSLPPPEYAEEEKEALIDFVLALKKTHIQEFFRRVKLQRSGTKTDLRERLQEAFDAGDVSYERAVDFLDSIAPWGKQHVFLYSGPRGDLRPWKDPDLLLQHLKQHRVGKYFNTPLPLILPEVLTLSSIAHFDDKLRVTAVQKRAYTERAPQHDDVKVAEDGTQIVLRAYANHVTRTLVTFEWDLISNTAMLQITQLHGDRLYEQVAEEFSDLVSAWLDIEKLFDIVEIREVIKRLHDGERNGNAEARSHGYQYRTPHGRRLAAHSPSPRDSVLGEAVIDDAMEGIRRNGVGHLGNFYWLSDGSPRATPRRASHFSHRHSRSIRFSFRLKRSDERRIARRTDGVVSAAIGR